MEETKPLLPKEFIQQRLIDNMTKMLDDKHFYFSFVIIGIGIEFLGKCIDTSQGHWNCSHIKPKDNFEGAINNIPALSGYVDLVKNHNFYNAFRNSLAHTLVPGNTLTISSEGDGVEHLYQYPNSGRTNLKCEEFYEDFKKACAYVINMPFGENDKMSKPLLMFSFD